MLPTLPYLLASKDFSLTLAGVALHLGHESVLGGPTSKLPSPSHTTALWALAKVPHVHVGLTVEKLAEGH